MSVFITREMITRAANDSRRNDTPSLFGSVASWVSTKWQHRKAIAELEAMDDASLRDIGLSRNDIRRAVTSKGMARSSAYAAMKTAQAA